MKLFGRKKRVDDEIHKNALSVEILDPDKVLYKGYSKAVSSINYKGKFDVLPGHTNFISLIKKEIVVLPQNGKKKRFEAPSGVLMVLDNTVKVFIGI